MRGARLVLRFALRTCAIACAVQMCAQANAADREFKDVVAAISEEFQTRPMHIPMLGLVSGVVKVVHPGGHEATGCGDFRRPGCEQGIGAQSSRIGAISGGPMDAAGGAGSCDEKWAGSDRPGVHV